MNAMESLSAHLKGRVAELWKMKADGVKIVGYSPGGYMPEELVYAADAVPVCLARGGEPEPITESLAYVPRFLDTFCRAQIGYRMMGEEPLYQMPDLMVVPITDINCKVIADCLNFYTDDDVFRLGVPSLKGEDASEYYLGSLQIFKEKLESLTGNKITDEKLRQAIESRNKMRGLLKAISLMRKDGPPPISSSDFVRLHHASFYADRAVFLDILEALYKELKDGENPGLEGKRILFTGSTLAMGDNKIFELMEGVGAEIVFEEFAEGIIPYMQNVDLEGDPMKALSDTYFTKRVLPAWGREWDETLDYLIGLTREFNVDGVLWYQLMYRDGYDMQAFYFEGLLKKETGLPMLKIESDYDTSEKGPFKTRIETFVQIIRGG
jgi:benzoyl-CoA reductase/2-hydroxyglutaryl-CoA dehydratase subunit BcrC/BadD/HgdB